MKALLVSLVFLAMASVSFAADGPIRHVVSFKFKSDASPEAVKKVEDAFAALQKQIPFIEGLEWGKNVSPEKHDKGFTHCWIVKFKNAQDRDAYLVHPDHKAFGGMLKGIIDDVMVLDFVPQK